MRWLDRLRGRDDDEEPAALPRSDRESEDVPIVGYWPALCPRCGSDDAPINGTHLLKQGLTRFHLCRCGQRFKSRRFPT